MDSDEARNFVSSVNRKISLAVAVAVIRSRPTGTTIEEHACNVQNQCWQHWQNVNNMEANKDPRVEHAVLLLQQKRLLQRLRGVLPPESNLSSVTNSSAVTNQSNSSAVNNQSGSSIKTCVSKPGIEVQNLGLLSNIKVHIPQDTLSVEVLNSEPLSSVEVCTPQVTNDDIEADKSSGLLSNVAICTTPRNKTENSEQLCNAELYESHVASNVTSQTAKKLSAYKVQTSQVLCAAEPLTSGFLKCNNKARNLGCHMSVASLASNVQGHNSHEAHSVATHPSKLEYTAGVNSSQLSTNSKALSSQQEPNPKVHNHKVAPKVGTYSSDMASNNDKFSSESSSKMESGRMDVQDDDWIESEQVAIEWSRDQWRHKQATARANSVFVQAMVRLKMATATKQPLSTAHIASLLSLDAASEQSPFSIDSGIDSDSTQFSVGNVSSSVFRYVIDNNDTDRIIESTMSTVLDYIGCKLRENVDECFHEWHGSVLREMITILADVAGQHPCLGAVSTFVQTMLDDIYRENAIDKHTVWEQQMLLLGELCCGRKLCQDTLEFLFGKLQGYVDMLSQPARDQLDVDQAEKSMHFIKLALVLLKKYAVIELAEPQSCIGDEVKDVKKGCSDVTQLWKSNWLPRMLEEAGDDKVGWEQVAKWKVVIEALIAATSKNFGLVAIEAWPLLAVVKEIIVVQQSDTTAS